MVNIRSWMNSNRLKMNDSKTEYIIFGSRQQLLKLQSTSLNVNDIEVKASNSVKYFGVHLDNNLSLKKHIKAKCRVASLNLYRIRNIRRYLTQDASNALILGLVIVHLAYANGLYIGLPNVDLKRLQRIQTLAAKIVLGRGRRESATQCLKDLHWLPVHLRVEYKILVTVFKCLNNQAPDYLKNMLHRPSITRTTRASKDQSRLVIPATRRVTFAKRSFSVSGPTLWNQLPTSLRNAPNLQNFKKELKTFLFSKF